MTFDEQRAAAETFMIRHETQAALRHSTAVREHRASERRPQNGSRWSSLVARFVAALKKAERWPTHKHRDAPLGVGPAITPRASTRHADQR